MRDVVGLYLDPPHNAAVFSFDEKSQIQALDRTQPGLPMKKGRCATMTHEYHHVVRGHGYRDLSAPPPRGVRFCPPKEQEIHIVLDNYATHKHEKVLAWIERKKRVFLHFIR